MYRLFPCFLGSILFINSSCAPPNRAKPYPTAEPPEGTAPEAKQEVSEHHENTSSAERADKIHEKSGIDAEKAEATEAEFKDEAKQSP